MNKNPCWKCGNRCVGCHGSCAAYKTWREGYDIEKTKTELSKRSANDYIATRGWLQFTKTAKWGV